MTEAHIPTLGEVGEILQSVGDYLQNAPVTPDVKRYGAYLEAVGEGMSASDMAGDAALDATENGKSAAEIAGGIAGALIGAAIPYAIVGTMSGAAAFSLFLTGIGAPRWLVPSCLPLQHGICQT